MIVSEALAQAERLGHSDSPRLDAEVLLADALGKTRTFLYTWPEHALSDTQQALYEQRLQRRAAGEPVAHILGVREFWSLALEVNASTLIPRPDTEIVVERALALLAEQAIAAPRILDLGTGTGAIALALAHELPGAQVTAVDLQPEAVALAHRNAQRLALANVQVKQSNWFQAVQGSFDLIVANPPYIDAADPHLQEGDVRFEPHSALVAQEQGLADLAYLSAQAPRYLAPGGWLLLEHGWQQGAAVRELLVRAGLQSVSTVEDYSGNQRVSGGQWRGE